MSRLVAHRGQKFTLPENTLESIQQAINCGARAVEFDVQMTADLVPVISHNPSLLKTAGVNINITKTNYTDIKDISVGEKARFAEQYLSITLPSLQDMVTMLKQTPHVMVFVELKNKSVKAFGIKCLVKQVLKQLIPIQKHCVVIADNLPALLTLRQQSTIPVGWIIHRWHEDDLKRAKKSEVDYMVINQKYYTAHDYDFAADDWSWMVYQTNDADEALALFDQGVDFVETNNICSMLKQLPDYK
jgi:glycerophosphoryl diester phosphodiesterase